MFTNRFIIGALDPGTTYYFRVKRCPSEGVADDAGKIDSKWTELCPVTTKAEPEVPADAVLFQDFRHLAYGGNKRLYGVCRRCERQSDRQGARSDLRAL